ncbi:MAG: exopolyphosphatase [Actinomycetaceae bacterium]|nr:exopolyphosphatase [Actinomycetaceae bacterium]
MPKVAAIDSGTNSLRLVVADLRDGKLHNSQKFMQVVRLGEGVDKTGVIGAAALGRARAAALEFRNIMQKSGVERLRIGATSAIRDARNADGYLDLMEAIFGTRPQVIAGTEEAALTYQGARASVVSPAPALVVDIGGGSTEYVLGGTYAVSTQMGAVRFTEKFGEDETRLRAAVAAQLTQVGRQVPLAQTRSLVGVGGTVTSVWAGAIGAVRDAPETVGGVALPIEQAVEACQRMFDMSVAQRESLPFMPPGRADVIGAGAIIWAETIRAVAAANPHLREVYCSTEDILDALALSLAD